MTDKRTLGIRPDGWRMTRNDKGYSELTHLRVTDKFGQTDPVAMVTKNREFKHKIG